MSITKIVEKYKFLFLLSFVVITIALMFNDVRLFDSIVFSIIFSSLAVTIKYYGDKLFDKWFSKKK